VGDGGGAAWRCYGRNVSIKDARDGGSVARGFGVRGGARMGVSSDGNGGDRW
jgi:hypothetical protein